MTGRRLAVRVVACVLLGPGALSAQDGSAGAAPDAPGFVEWSQDPGAGPPSPAEPAPKPPPATPSSTAEPPALPPAQPAEAAPAAVPSASPEGSPAAEAPPPVEAAPAPAAEAPPPSASPQGSHEVVATPLPPPSAGGRRGTPKGSDDCRDGRPPTVGLLKAGLPAWVAGAVMGAAVGALAMSVVGFGGAVAAYAVTRQGWLPSPPSQWPSLYLLAFLGLPTGALVGGVAGGVVAPFLPALPGLLWSRRCGPKPGADPTLRKSGASLN